jgi:DNA invertase Pin-like site-specific DNA recombinase
MRAAIYARMSTDKQSADSPADQIARCREFARARGWKVVEALVVSEAGISGASRHNRPGLLELVARIDEWDVLLCWDSSRLARDSEDLGWIRNRLRAHRRSGHEVSTGLDLFNVGAKVLGVMAEEYLVKLAADTQRGLRGRAERGLATGGRPYGYRSEPVALDEQGRAVEGAGFRLVVDEAEAAVVRRIFDLYLGGDGLRAIAHRLNSEGVAAPRPRALRGRPPSWAPTSIREMLRNQIYRGEKIFGRSEWVKDHETGKRRRHERPETEWVRQHEESLRIVSDDVWQRTAARAGERAAGITFERDRTGRILSHSGLHSRATRASHPLSGLLECGACGGAFFAVTGGAVYGCGWHRDRGPEVCKSELRVPRTALEARIYGAIRGEVLTPENLQRAIERAFEIVRSRLAESDPESDRRRLAELEVEVDRAVDLGVRTGGLDAVQRKLKALEAERIQILARLDRAPALPDYETLTAAVVHHAKEWQAAFEGSPDHARRALRALLGDERMRVYSDAERGFRVEGLLRVPTSGEPFREGSERLACGVAGGGFEPPTSGL